MFGHNVLQNIRQCVYSALLTQFNFPSAYETCLTEWENDNEY